MRWKHAQFKTLSGCDENALEEPSIALFENLTFLGRRPTHRQKGCKKHNLNFSIDAVFFAKTFERNFERNLYRA